MAADHDTRNPTTDNLIEATEISASPDFAVNAIMIEVLDQTGQGVRFLVGRHEAVHVCVGILTAYKELTDRVAPAGILSARF